MNEDSNQPLPDMTQAISIQKQLLQNQERLARFGLYPEIVVDATKRELDVLQAFDPSLSADKRTPLSPHQAQLIKPPCFDEFKIPNMIGLGVDKEAERVLFTQAMQIKDILVPLTAAILLLPNNQEFALDILSSIKTDLVEKLQCINFKRFVAQLPSDRSRLIATAPENSVLRHDPTLDLLKQIQSLEALLPSKSEPRSGKSRARGGRQQKPQQSRQQRQPSQLQPPPTQQQLPEPSQPQLETTTSSSDQATTSASSSSSSFQPVTRRGRGRSA